MKRAPIYIAIGLVGLAFTEPSSAYWWHCGPEGTLSIDAATTEGEVTRCLKAGLDPNSANEFGMEPLHMAARYGNLEVAAALLNAGADPDAPEGSPSGSTPLKLAVGGRP